MGCLFVLRILRILRTIWVRVRICILLLFRVSLILLRVVVWRSVAFLLRRSLVLLSIAVVRSVCSVSLLIRIRILRVFAMRCVSLIVSRVCLSGRLTGLSVIMSLIFVLLSLFVSPLRMMLVARSSSGVSRGVGVMRLWWLLSLCSLVPMRRFVSLRNLRVRLSRRVRLQEILVSSVVVA